MNHFLGFVTFSLIPCMLFGTDLEKKSQRRSVPEPEKTPQVARLSDSALFFLRKKDKQNKGERSAKKSIPAISNSDVIWKKIEAKRYYITAQMLRGVPSQDLNAPLRVHRKCLKHDEGSLYRAMRMYFLSHELGHKEAREELFQCFEELQKLQRYKSEQLNPEDSWECLYVQKALNMITAIKSDLAAR